MPENRLVRTQSWRLNKLTVLHPLIDHGPFIAALHIINEDRPRCTQSAAEEWVCRVSGPSAGRLWRPIDNEQVDRVEVGDTRL